MIYSAPDGIHVLDLATRATKLLVANPPSPTGPPSAAATPESSTSSSPDTKPTASSTPPLTPPRHRRLQGRHQHRRRPQTGRSAASTQHLWLVVVSVNADETLIAGTYVEGKTQAGNTAPTCPPNPRRSAGAAGNPDNRVGSATQGPHYQPPNKSAMMVARLAANSPLSSSPSVSSPAPRRETRRPSNPCCTRPTGSTISSSPPPIPASSCTATRASGRTSTASG